MKKLLICLLALAMMIPAALAETITLDGTVVSTETVPVVSPAAGVLYHVYFSEGDRVSAGAEAATLYAQPVFAAQAGTVKVFGTVGESVEALIARYGAVAYIEPDCEYTVSASTRNAYDAIENGIIHPGETVYLSSASNGKHTGVGQVTAVTGASYTVEVSEGVFEANESVYVYRSDDYDKATRIGRGTAAHAAPVAVTGLGTGIVSDVHVADGAHVEIGEALFDAVQVDTASSFGMISPVDGTVAAVRVVPGDVVTQGAVVAEIYPHDAMRVEMSVSENDLRDVRIGTRVSIEFKSGETADGEVERISAVAQAAVAEGEETTDDTVYFKAYVRFTAPETVRYGMTAKVTTVDGAQE